MSKNLPVSNLQRRKIRKLIREEFQRQKILTEHINGVQEKMFIYESKSIKSGLSQEMINEGLMDIINEGFGDVGFDMIKRYLGTIALSFIGINKTDDPFMFTLLQNVIEAVDYREFTKFFGAETRCDEMMEVLTEAIVETVTEIGGQKVLMAIAGKFLPDGVAGTVESALDSSLAAVSTEATNEVVVGLVKGYLQEPMREYVCGGKLMDAVKGFFGFGGSSESGGGFGIDLDKIGQTAMGALGDFGKMISGPGGLLGGT